MLFKQEQLKATANGDHKTCDLQFYFLTPVNSQALFTSQMSKQNYNSK